jgi:hypothetical protein
MDPFELIFAIAAGVVLGWLVISALKWLFKRDARREPAFDWWTCPACNLRHQGIICPDC